MPYTHKKSIRKLTDKQFSRETAIDASEIDGALEDAVEHFNEMSPGDLSTRMTPTQFVFGYTPAPLASQPVFDRHVNDHIVPIGSSWRSQNTYAPWLPVINSKWTSITVDTSVDPTVSYAGTYSNNFTPTEGFQNKWRIKGTELSFPGGPPAVPVNTGSMMGDAYWSGPLAPPAEGLNSSSTYQFAWTNSWQFNRPGIVDDISIMMRTDNTTTGLFDIDWSYPIGADTYGAADFFIVLHVDSPTATEDRSANDVEGYFGDSDIYIARVSMGQTPAGAGIFIYTPMNPLVQGGATVAPTPGEGLRGRTIRWREMNIPIHQGARVRLSLVVPHYGSGAPVFYQGGWSKGNLPDHIYVQTVSWNDATGATPPDRNLAMHNFSMSGAMTVLEEVQG